jgi:hypothetical protein
VAAMATARMGLLFAVRTTCGAGDGTEPLDPPALRCDSSPMNALRPLK